MVRILLVEDDLKLSHLVMEFLQGQGYEAAVEVRGDRAVDRILGENPNLVILDIMLPGIDGFEVCRRVRPTYTNPILMLTARGDEADELIGLEAGADDYLSKPVRPELLLARIKTCLRRSRDYNSVSRQIRRGSITIDAGKRTVQEDGQSLDLTTAEFDLLWLMANSAGRIVTRDQISNALHGREWDGLDRSVDLCISRLRKKLGDDGRKPEKIRSIRGSGYMWVS